MPRMIDIPTAPGGYNFDGVSRWHGPCVCCGRDVKNPAGWVYMVNGGNKMLHNEDSYADCGSDLGLQPVGSTCIRLIPKEYRWK